MQKRQVLEEAELLDPRISALEEDLDEVESSEEEEEEEEKVAVSGPANSLQLSSRRPDFSLALLQTIRCFP